jgi:hypothetical protein
MAVAVVVSNTWVWGTAEPVVIIWLKKMVTGVQTPDGTVNAAPFASLPEDVVPSDMENRIAGVVQTPVKVAFTMKAIPVAPVTDVAMS